MPEDFLGFVQTVSRDTNKYVCKKLKEEGIADLLRCVECVETGVITT
jgi:hypothetical protein